MKNLQQLLYILILATFTIACKNEETKDITNSDKEMVTNENDQNIDKKTDSNLDKKLTNSVISKLMFTEEAKSFVRFLISAELIDQLSTEEGPFTILAPNNKAFSSLPQEQLNSLHNYRNKEFLSRVLKTHIIDGNIDTVTLVQEIKKSNGKFTVNTLSGEALIISMDGSSIVITDEKGSKAVIGKSDINASNGVVHILDAVLGMD